MELKYGPLKDRQRAIRDGFPPSLALRVHRALSWLNRSEQETDDHDARFIFLWIAFNSAYANDLHDRINLSERNLFSNFIERLVALDKDKILYNTIWQEFTKSIRLLINNKYVFQPFWDYQNGLKSESEWQAAFEKSNAAATRALGNMETAKVIMIVLERLYTLRNQLIHGGATWKSKVNRDQIRDGACIMNKMVPAIIHIMMENSGEVWGDPCYPVVDEA